MKTNRTFEFWLGRAGSGKTYACLDAIARQVDRHPRGLPLIFLVPEQATAQMEYALARRTTHGGYTRASVTSFRGLVRDVFAAAGGRPRDVIDEESRVILLRRLLRGLGPNLQTLGSTGDLPGAAEAVSKALLEFQRYGWSPADLERRIAVSETGEEAAEPLRRKLSDLLLIWEAYEAELTDRVLFDSAKLIDVAAERLKDWAELEGARIWVDGFASFTAQERNLLEAAIEHAEGCAVAVCLDPDNPSFKALQKTGSPISNRIGSERAFENNERFYISLRSRLRDLGWEVKDLSFPEEGQPRRFSASDELSHLEAEVLLPLRPRVFAPVTPDCQREPAEAWPVGPIELIEAENPRVEVEAVARRIAAICGAPSAGGKADGAGSPQGLHWSDVTVITRDLETYAPFIEEIFPRFGIGFFLDRRRPIVAHPLARLLLGVLDLVEFDWSADAVIDYLKTGLTPAGERDGVARIENLARQRKFRAADWSDPHRWGAARPRPGSKEPSGEGTAHRPGGEELFELWQQAAAPIEALKAELAGASIGGSIGETRGSIEPARALWKFLLDLGAGERIEQWMEQAHAEGDEEAVLFHGEAWKGIVDVLDRLDNLGHNPKERVRKPGGLKPLVTELREAIETGLATAPARLIPPTADQVLIGSIERSRTPEVRAAFVLGWNEGDFPPTFEEDPMLADRDRTYLTEKSGLELGPGSAPRFNQERYLAYIALTRASQYLAMSRPLVDAEGRPSAPSSYFRAVAAAFPGVEVQRIVSDEEARNSGHAPRLPVELAREALEAFHGAVLGEASQPLGRFLFGSRDLSFAGPQSTLDANDRAAVEKVFDALDWPKSATLDPDLAHEFWSGDHELSVTALESFGACPFKFFASRMLRLQRPAEPIPGPMELGQLRHRILERLFERLRTRGSVDWGEVDLSRAKRIIEDEGRRIAEAELADDLGSDSLAEALVGHVIEELKHFAEALVAMGRRYGFVQIAAEYSFGGPDGALVQLPATDGIDFSIRGVVDRVDRMRGEGDAAQPDRLVVFDYKSGRKPLNATRLVHGLDLQLPVYALALERTYRRRGGVENDARVVGAFYWPLSIGIATAEGESWAEPASPAWFAKHRAEGLFDESVARALDREAGEDNRALAFNVKWNKGGESLHKGTKGWLGSGAFRAFLGGVWTLLGERVEKIAAGEIGVQPWTADATAPCDQCEFGSVCRIKTMAADSVRKLETISFKELRELETGGGRILTG